MFFITGVSECGSNAPDCDARKSIELLFWLFGFTAMAALCGLVVYRIKRKVR